MAHFNNYEEYCKAFTGDDVTLKKEAELLLFIQDWIINVVDYIDEDTMDFSLKTLLARNSNKASMRGASEDALSSIIDDTRHAFRYLNDNLHKKNVRENVLMPVYEAKEINSYGLNWLSRQSGRTIKQKISSAGNSIMAVQRRTSLDTAENRLFLAFAKELYDQLAVKTRYYKKNNLRDEEVDFMGELSSFIFKKEIEEIRRWENLPPNNTLLSDQNYKKIWYGWNELKKLDDRILDNSENIGKCVATIFFVEILTQLRNVLRITQEPLEVDYDTYNVYLCQKTVACLDKKDNIVEITRNENKIVATTIGKTVSAEFNGSLMKISEGNIVFKELEISPDKFTKCVQLFVTKLGIGSDKNKGYIEEKKIVKHSEVIIDLFALHPMYLSEDDRVTKLPERLLQQRYHGIDIDGDERDYYVPCGKTNAIKMIHGTTETYTIPYAVDNGSMEQMKRLMHMMESYISTSNFTYVFPDAYSEFQLSMVHKTSRMAFRNVKNIPNSVGTAFYYQQTDDFKNKFESGDFLLVLDVIDDEVSFTLLSGIYDEEIEKDISEYKGIVWERHPTSTVSCKEDIDEKIVDKLIKLGCIRADKIYKLFGKEGLRDEIDNLSFCFENGNWFSVKKKIEKVIDSFKINVTDYIAEFLLRNSHVIKKSTVHILSMDDSMIYKGGFSYNVVNKEDVLRGCKFLYKLQSRTDLPLWHDHLPALAIKLMCGKFDLIKNAKILPQFNTKQVIDISNTFTLPKNCKEYHFNLVQDDNARKMQYEAVIKNPAFPLNKDVECKLHLTYQYGAEEPYELIFIPLNSKNAGFAEAKVEWSRLIEYPIDNLNIPEFPHKLSWEDMKKYPGKEGLINVFEELTKQYNSINEGYYRCDITDTSMRKDRDGKMFGEFNIYKKDNSLVRIFWHERDWDKRAKVPDNITAISFWIAPKRDEKETRYYIDNLWAARTRDNLWFTNKMGSRQCIVNFNYNGEDTTISILEQKFDMPENFHEGINNISFAIKKGNNGRLQAINIHDEDGPAAPERYNALNICEGDRKPIPPRYLVNSYYGKWTRTMFANNRSLAEEGCPDSFRRIFDETINNYVNLFYQYQDTIEKKEVFTFLSLAANDIGTDYYDMANNMIEMYQYDEIEMPYEIGCAFSDLSTERQRELMSQVLDVSEDICAIGILSKAMWHNENFIFNVDFEKILSKYMSIAVDYIGECLRRCNGGRFRENDLENVKYCLEFILGSLRLRKLNDNLINKNYLSLNNMKLQELYKYLEIMVDNNTKIYSFLKLEVSNKGVYDNICDLIYVLLVYVTGANTDAEIKISGIVTDD